jgi:hypothetical protein
MNGGGGGGTGITPLQRSATFLRDGRYTDEIVVETKSLHAGYYASRTPHMYPMVYITWERTDNGRELLPIRYAITDAIVNHLSWQQLRLACKHGCTHYTSS